MLEHLVLWTLPAYKSKKYWFCWMLKLIFHQNCIVQFIHQVCVHSLLLEDLSKDEDCFFIRVQILTRQKCNKEIQTSVRKLNYPKLSAWLFAWRLRSTALYVKDKFYCENIKFFPFVGILIVQKLQKNCY